MPDTVAESPTAAPDALRLQEQLCFALYSAMLGMNKVYRQQLRRLGLTYPQYLVMLVLWEHAPLSVSAIGARLFLDSPTLTPLLKRLEAQGWVQRQRARHDERQVLVDLTDTGRARRADALAVPAAVFCAVGCQPDELVALRTQLLALRDRLLQAAADAA